MRHDRTIPTGNRSQSSRHPRSGHLYVAIMVVATLVSMIGLCGITVARAKLRAAQHEQDRQEARILASAAIENGLASINKNALWRITYALGIEFPATAHTLGNGTISCTLTDPDGNLGDNPFDSAFLSGIGRVGNAVFVRRVQIEPSGSGTEMRITPGSWEDAAAP